MNEHLISADVALEMLKLHRLEVNDLEDQLELLVRRCQSLEDQVQGLIVERDELMRMLTASSSDEPDQDIDDPNDGMVWINETIE